MSEEKLVPKLRFLEFTDEWSEHKFENIFDIKNGLNKGKDYFGEGIRILNYMDVNKYELNTENTIKGLVELTDDEIERYSVKPNDLFFTRTSETSEEIGLTSAYMGNTIKCVFSGFLLRARPKIDLNSLFFAYYLRSPRQRNNIIKFSSITTRALISGGNLSKMKIKYPSIEEQNKIANLFLILDKKVELLEKKYREYQCFKKYLMQKLFAQELRFNFTDDWNYMNFSEIFKSVSTKKYQIKSADILDKGDFEVIDQGQDEIAGYFNDKTKLCQELPIIIYGDHTTFVKFRDKPFIVGADGVKLLIPKFNANPKYLFYALEHFNIKPEGYKRHFSIIKKIKLPIPTLEEQNEISEIFTYIDIKLKYTKIQLQETEEFKKGLLQQMFVVQLILSLLQNKKHI
ncbi:restriction endonuclease subunit S [Methanobrevibacter smithii]|uniref:restriction endonuclease subunit S n=1 Tax=Methanobrevibacter smithii TaxID=2173 RepID=UPI00384C09A4